MLFVLLGAGLGANMLVAILKEEHWVPHCLLPKLAVNHFLGGVARARKVNWSTAPTIPQCFGGEGPSLDGR